MSTVAHYARFAEAALAAYDTGLIASGVPIRNRSSGQKVLAIRGAESSEFFVDYITDIFIGQLRTTRQYVSLDDSYQQLVSDGKLGASEAFVVTGHSLDGFVARVFVANHANVVSAAYTYNAPGSGGILGHASDERFTPLAFHGGDVLDGGTGNDTLFGGRRDERLYRGAGNDRLRGGYGVAGNSACWRGTA